MTVTTPDIVLALEILIVMATLFIGFAYLLEQVQSLRTELRSLRDEVKAGDNK